MSLIFNETMTIKWMDAPKVAAAFHCVCLRHEQKHTKQSNIFWRASFLMMTQHLDPGKSTTIMHDIKISP